MYINYNNSIVNLPNSILKYFGFTPFHKTNEIIDKELKENNYDNVIIMLFDALGVKNINDHLTNDSFIKKHLVTSIHSTFPPTTTASTTSVKTGLYPSEHLYLGWDMYFKEEDDCIDIFINKSKKNKTYDYHVIDKYTKPTSIVSMINEKYYAKEISPFGDIKYESLAELETILKDETAKPGKKYFYVYNTEPDHTMHLKGVECDEVKEKILEINHFLENLKLNNTLLIVVADHGHITADHLYLDDYPRLKGILRTPTTIEDRSVGLNIKEGTDDILFDEYNKYFKDDFYLLSKKEVLENNLYGLNSSDKFESFLPDYLMISHTKKALIDDPKKHEYLKGMHAGLTEDEKNIPLILIKFKG